MNFGNYILSKIPYIIMNFIIYLLGAVVLKIADIPNVILFFIFFIWFIPLIVYIGLQFVQEKKFYGEMTELSGNLDKKYLLSEIIKKPNYYEGRIFYEVLKDANRNMHEEVNYYKHLQSDYREYIETWVHEIKTPIASSKMILENSISNDKNALVDEMNKIDRYITQALYYSRSTDFNKDYIIKTFNLQSIINECIRENRREFINKKIRLIIDDNTHVQVTSDAKWLKFIINQIIINSIKYSRNECAEIKIYIEEHCNNTHIKDDFKKGLNDMSDANKKVKLVIEDNGIGIPKSDINRVFDKGFTGENGRIYGKSTGIGLYLCKKLCEKLNVNIELFSEPEVFTKVFIEILK